LSHTVPQQAEHDQEGTFSSRSVQKSGTNFVAVVRAVVAEEKREGWLAEYSQAIEGGVAVKEATTTCTVSKPVES
jgi:hypothetical protein